jgi:D-threo-aldose 1-dehydrogenase
MKTRVLGRTNALVTSLGFGAAPIGNLFTSVTDEDAEGAIRAAWDGGVRYFDTAPHYGLGLSERRLGEVLASYERVDYSVSSKVGRLLRPNLHPLGSDLAVAGFAVADEATREIDYSAEGVTKSIEESLERLGVDYLDIVYVHDPDEFVDQVVHETIPALARMRDDGVIRAIGAGMNDWRPLLEFVARGDIDVVMLAGRWTLLDRSGAPLLEECARRGVAVVAAAPFNSGILARNDPRREDSFDYQAVSADRLAKAQSLAELCARHRVDLPHVALQFPLRSDVVVSVVAGMRSPYEAERAAEWIDSPVPGELWDELDDLDEEWLER